MCLFLDYDSKMKRNAETGPLQEVNSRLKKLHKGEIYWGWILFTRIGVAFIACPLFTFMHTVRKHIIIG